MKILIVFLAALGAAVWGRADEALHVRDGLPNVAARCASAHGELRVAYLGGSITAAANGWRTLTTDYLRATHPGLTITEIAAGVPGTGSDLGACRVDRDVLRHHPDLLFVEFAVNDANMPPDKIQQTMEGIVRQTWAADPRTDICFVYTVAAPALPDIAAGRFQPSAQAMETVAEHYGIPTLHFGFAVKRALDAHAFVFKPQPGSTTPPPFTRDGVHPTEAGYRVYFDVIKRSLPALLAQPAATPHRLGAPLRDDNWAGATLRPIDAVARTGSWALVPMDDANLRGSTKPLLPPVWRTAQPGAAIEFSFTGRIFGLVGIAAPDNGEFAVTVDDLPPVTATLFDRFVSPTFCREREWFYPRPLTDGTHRVRVELRDTVVDKAAIKAKPGHPLAHPELYAKNELTLCGVLVVGDTAR